VKPSIGRVVHYVSHGTPPQPDGSQAYASECRAAIITEVPELLSEQPNNGSTVSLCVLNPTGQFFSREIPYQEAGRPGDPDCRYSDMHGGSAFISCSCGWSERKLVGGTWHWPERAGGES
jgi:hypothetical protein